MGDAEAALRILNELKSLGVRIAIDDFGTDYSSLARLNRLPVDMLKIDRAFLRDVPGDPRAARLIAAIVGVADALEMGTVAEGVEHEAQVDFLRRAGATHIQGFLYSRPLPADRAVALLQPVPAGGGEGALATTAIRSRKSGAHIRSATPAS
jgi:EAL domain-containing protein (putative c-di-GMP-specific phosphodiesterase class I)